MSNVFVQVRELKNKLKLILTDNQFNKLKFDNISFINSKFKKREL